MKSKRTFAQSLKLFLAIIVGITTFAYGFAITRVDFSATTEPERAKQLTRILRGLAQPTLFDYDQEEQVIDMPIFLPCPEDGDLQYHPDTNGPFLRMIPLCGSPNELVVIEGYNFWPNTKGPVNFVPAPDVNLTLGSFTTDSKGYFRINAKLPNRQPVAEAQTLRAIARRNIGTPHFSEMANYSWVRIVETVFMALLATTFGTIISIPVSFLAARNLMSDVKLPLSSLALSILGWPAGIYAGLKLLAWSRIVLLPFSSNLAVILAGIIVLAALIFLGIKWSLPQDEDDISGKKPWLGRWLVSAILLILGVSLLILIYRLALNLGVPSNEPTENFAFFGNFVYQIGDLLQIIAGVIVSLSVGSILGGLGTKAGQFMSDKWATGKVRLINLIITPLAGFIVMALVGAGLDWFYQFNNPATSLYWPGGIGIAGGLLLALLTKPKTPLPNGSVIYLLTRGILNFTRSIEPLIMAIVFVVWLGLGPFAGAMALGLHTIASLSKLFSEQVENISYGPLEAIQATGANRLQTIIYAVVPQIIPPYISFTMYRWDINVRMSTIIGFVGGGGIGSLLSQNINLLRYRDAAVQMLFIAIVVATMDYISSTLRERFV
ncbi:MAG: ABC transporter permease subunit [Anaerolineae bacterium]|nr:ABC transporter permease subunit [Anaerolineae bacterium]